MSAPSNPSPVSESHFPSKDGTRLFMTSRPPVGVPKASVLFLHGYADHASRYGHVLEALAAAGYAAHALDYRGHGRAGGRRGYVGRFGDYLDDVETAIARIRAASGAPLFIFAHSHGCLVACTLVLRDPRLPVEGLVLSSPYFRLKLAPGWFQLFQAKVVGKLIPVLSVKNPLTSDLLTHDAAMRAASDADTLKHTVVTPRWFSESNEAQLQLFANARRFVKPLLVMQAGDDAVADPQGARDFVDSAGSHDKRLTVYPGMFHEILHEVEREKPVAEAVAWLDAHARG
ncbi:MAG: hypothetical protein RL199_1351 [Pseudomonadota bacterium]|jgi:alpha-beta hydrolase superfamily lysophospholipase